MFIVYLYHKESAMSLHRFPEINQVACSGRLTRDPETRITQTGKLRVTFDVAVNLSYRDKNDDWKQETSFIPVVSWDKLAEAIAENLHKGSGVFLTGRLHSRKLEGAHGNRSMIEVVARTVQFLDRKKEQDSQTTPPPFNGQEEKDDAPAF
jgi:single-strand DNA-binding protein